MEGFQHVNKTGVPKNIKIGYIIDNLGRAGTQTFLVKLTRGLTDYGYDQRVYCLNNSTNKEVIQSLKDCGVSVVVIGKLQLILITGLLRLIIEFTVWRPHIIQTFLPFGDIIGRTVARITNIPVIVSSIRARNVDKKWWQFLLDKITIRWVNKVVFNSNQIIPFAIAHEGIHKSHVVYIPNGIDVPQKIPVKTLSGIRKHFNIDPSISVIGTVGRLCPQKGYQYLLQAYRKVSQKEPDSALLIIGDGPLQTQLQEEAEHLGIANHITFLKERTDISELLSIMDVYVQSSLWEGMPNAVMEAMAAGKPIVLTNVDGGRELIEDQVTGWLVEPADIKALASSILYVLKNKDEAKRVGATASEHVHKNYPLDKMISSYNELYRGLLKDYYFK